MTLDEIVQLTRQLSLLDKVRLIEEIARQIGQELKATQHALPESVGLRPFGLSAGEFVVPDDFDEGIPNAIADEFQGR